MIKRATPSDVPSLLLLVEGYWSLERIDGFDAERVAAQLERVLSEARLGGAWIAVADGVAVGHLIGVYVFSLEHMGLTAEIDELFVAASQRGKGTGKALLSAAEREFARIGCTNVSLELGRANESAREFYRRAGYRERSRYELLDKTL